MWTTSCFEYQNDIFHVEDRAWRILQRARDNGVVYSEAELKKEILELMKHFEDFTDEGLDQESSLPKKIVKSSLSRTDFPIYLVIVEDKVKRLRMLKTFWTDREVIRNGTRAWEKLKKKHISN